MCREALLEADALRALRPQSKLCRAIFKFLGSKNPQHGTAPRAFRGKSASVRADCRRFQPFADVFLKWFRLHQTSWLRKRQPQTVHFSYFKLGLVPFLHRNAPGMGGVTTGKIGETFNGSPAKISATPSRLKTSPQKQGSTSNTCGPD